MEDELSVEPCYLSSGLLYIYLTFMMKFHENALKHIN
jgi:hypothetical protein